jgi:hypothetical protein
VTEILIYKNGILSAIKNKNFIGYEIYNCCGCFVIALPKQQAA